MPWALQLALTNVVYPERQVPREPVADQPAVAPTNAAPVTFLDTLNGSLEHFP